ncbi:MAG: dihydrolipoyl dehydrogenase [Anaerolineales bacterium]|nr:MAG: dihydrolipoyl dehydrogenase [Anaerolineales bacterium]
MKIQTDIAILGGGPGGYVAALRAAQLGAQVVLIEEDTVGGVCLNVGCIPTKALLRSAEVYRAFLRAEAFGLRLEGSVTPDWPAIQGRKGGIVRQLVHGVEVLLRKAGVQVLQGRGRFVAPRVLEVTTADGVQRAEAKNVIIATGSRPVRLPLPGMDLPGVIDSTGALALEALPQRLLVIGGGVVGIEFADIFNAFDVEVAVVEMLDRILPQMDGDLGKALAWTMVQRGVELYLNSQVTGVDAVEGGLRATVVTPSGEVEMGADRVVVAVGRRPNVEDLGLEAAGVRFDKTGIPVDTQMQTNVPGVYAVGDVTGGALLAHVAMRGGEVAVENALGHVAAFDPKTTPWCVYTDPEVASVGLTEAQAREGGYEVQVGRFPLTASGKAQTYGDTDGFVKVVSEARFGEVLGLHIVAPHASDLIHEGGLALALEATLEELVATVHGHPTLGEAVREAALEVRGEALHLPH